MEVPSPDPLAAADQETFRALNTAPGSPYLGRRFAGRTCVVTGSGGGIGRAAAIRFAREGGNVVGADINSDAAEETVAQIREEGGSIISIHPCDAADKTDCVRLIQAAVDKFGCVDVVFNNGANASFAWVTEMSDDDWEFTLNSELTSVFLLSRAAWPELIKSRGVIINTASVSGWMGFQMLPGLAHSAAKGGVLSLTRHLAMEGRQYGIRANSVSPGTIATAKTRRIAADPDWRRVQFGRAMMNRMGEPEEVAAAVAFLASDDASYITAADIRVDGGIGGW